MEIKEIAKRLEDIFNEEEFWDVYYCVKISEDCDPIKISSYRMISNQIIGTLLGGYILDIFFKNLLYYTFLFINPKISKAISNLGYADMAFLFLFVLSLSLYSYFKGKEAFKEITKHLTQNEKVIFYYILRKTEDLGETRQILKKKFPDVYRKLRGVLE